MCCLNSFRLKMQSSFQFCAKATRMSNPNKSTQVHGHRPQPTVHTQTTPSRLHTPWPSSLEIWRCKFVKVRELDLSEIIGIESRPTQVGNKCIQIYFKHARNGWQINSYIHTYQQVHMPFRFGPYPEVHKMAQAEHCMKRTGRPHIDLHWAAKQLSPLMSKKNWVRKKWTFEKCSSKVKISPLTGNLYAIWRYIDHSGPSFISVSEQFHKPCRRVGL